MFEYKFTVNQYDPTNGYRYVSFIGSESDVKIISANDEEKVDEAIAAINLPASTKESLSLPTIGLNDVKISWKSHNQEIMADDGTLILPSENTKVLLEATFTLNNVTKVGIMK